MTSTLPSAVRPEDAAAVTRIVRQLATCWEQQDADQLAEVYAPDASVILPGAYLKGRKEIRDWMTAAFDGKWHGTKVLGAPLELRPLGENLLLLMSEGGAYPPGATEVPVEHAIRGCWLFIRRDSEWLVHAYANTSAQKTIPLR